MRLPRRVTSAGQRGKTTQPSTATTLDIGDRVRLRSPEDGPGGDTGTVSGLTTPSVTGVEVIGDASLDVAVNVVFGEGDGAWYSPDLLELVDHGPGTTAAIAGVELVRAEDGAWVQVESRDRTAGDP